MADCSVYFSSEILGWLEKGLQMRCEEIWKSHSAKQNFQIYITASEIFTSSEKVVEICGHFAAMMS